MGNLLILDAAPETLGAIKSKAEYIADVVRSLLAAERTMPIMTAEDLLRQLEAIADAVDEYNDLGEED